MKYQNYINWFFLGMILVCIFCLRDFRQRYEALSVKIESEKPLSNKIYYLTNMDAATNFSVIYWEKPQ